MELTRREAVRLAGAAGPAAGTAGHSQAQCSTSLDGVSFARSVLV
jgi:hypothetical protein